MGIGQPTIAGGIPADESYLVRRMEALETVVKQFMAANTLRAATISGGAGQGIRTEDFDGTSFAAPGTTGNYFGADGAVIGNIFLRPGTVTNDALQNPVSNHNFNSDLASTNLTVLGADLITGSITVPTGFSQALVVVIGTVGDTRNASAGGGAFYAQTFVNGTGGGNGPNIGSSCADNSSMSTTTSVAATITGLVGGGSLTFGIWGAVDTLTGWTSGAANAHVMASATFLR